MTVRKSILPISIVLLIVLALFGAYVVRKMMLEPSVGGLYMVFDSGEYRVVKVLALDDTGVHVRVYKNKFPVCETDVDERQLTLGTIHDKDGFGMGHLPLSRKAFHAWRPAFIKQSTVADNELDGYKMWKESGGGVWE